MELCPCSAWRHSNPLANIAGKHQLYAAFFSLREEAGVNFILKKCAFLTDVINCLGHVIHSGRLEADRYSTEATTYLRILTTQTRPWLFTSLCNLFRRFFTNFASIASPLAMRPAKSQAMELAQFNGKKVTTLPTLQKKLNFLPILALLRRVGHYTRHTEGRDRQIGCVLLRKQDETVDKPNGFCSNFLKNREKLWTALTKSALQSVGHSCSCFRT